VYNNARQSLPKNVFGVAQSCADIIEVDASASALLNTMQGEECVMKFHPNAILHRLCPRSPGV
jgi:hypothetical protein